MRVSSSARTMYSCGLAGAVVVALWDNSVESITIVLCWAIYAPFGYWRGRQDESEESGP